MVGVLQDVFQPLYVFGMKSTGMNVYVVEAEEKECCRCFDLKSMAVLGCDEEHVAGLVIEFVLIDALYACSSKNVYQLEEQVAMFLLGALVQRFVNDFERLEQAFPRFHGYRRVVKFFISGVNLPKVRRFIPGGCSGVGRNLRYKIIQTVMKAILLHEFGGGDNLIYADVSEPVLQNDDVLVDVKAISINPVDVKTRAGKGLAGRLKDQLPLVLGWDISGTVVAVGKDVTQFRIGDDVFGMVNFPGHGRAYAERVPAPAHHLALKPAGISHEEAAAGTLALLTVYQAMTEHARITTGQRVLVHAAAGGVGHFAVQLAKHFGAYVIGTSSAANRDFILGLGADEHIDYRSQRFEDVVRDVDFVLDTLGGENIVRSLEVIRRGGTIISIPSGLNAEVVALAAAKGIHGQFILVQSSGEDMRAVADLLGRGFIKAHVSKVFAFEEMKAAHAWIESGRTVGKIVVKGVTG
jgi:NADPH:quinone reductase-like Zn-dependent oxidoreductase